MKTKEELNAPKEEVETMSSKSRQLTEEELLQVSGGNVQQEISNLAKNTFSLKKKILMIKPMST